MMGEGPVRAYERARGLEKCSKKLKFRDFFCTTFSWTHTPFSSHLQLTINKRAPHIISFDYNFTSSLIYY